MKMLISLFVVLVLSACSYDLPENSRVDWVLGSDKMNYTYSFTGEKNREYNLTLSSNSLCPNTSVQIKVLDGQQIVLDTVITGPNIDKGIKFKTSGGNKVNVESSLISVPNQGECVWLGQVSFTLLF